MKIDNCAKIYVSRYGSVIEVTPIIQPDDQGVVLAYVPLIQTEQNTSK